MVTFSPDPVFLLWSREGSDDRPGAWYEPNHFVPLCSVERDDVGERGERSGDKSVWSNRVQGSKGIHTDKRSGRSQGKNNAFSVWENPQKEEFKRK